MKKILNIEEKPPFTFLLYPAYRTSILSIREYTVPWFLSSFVLFSCKANGEDFGIEFIANPFLKEFDFIYNTKNISKTIRRIKRSIDSGIYISLTWDESMVSCRPSYIEGHYKHPVLIYGYDFNEKIFYVSGYSEREVYENRTVNFYEFERAYSFYKKSKWKYFVWTVAHNRKFNLEKFNKTISWYLNSVYPSNKRLTRTHSLLRDKCFGMSVYSCLLSQLYIEKNECNKNYYNILKALTAYCEHKNYLLNAFKFIEKNNIISFNIDTVIEKYEFIVEQFQIIKELQIKYAVTMSDKEIDKIIEKIKMVSAIEKETLEYYLRISMETSNEINNSIFQ